MVHRGKLSAACGPCRSRHLKCDQKRPFCSQCIRAKRECFGYRDISGGRFYDQTDEVKKRNSPSSASSSALVPSPPQKRRLGQSASPPLIQQHISVVSAPLADQGAAFMLSRYPARDRVVGGRGPVNGFLPYVLCTPAGRAVTTSLNAAGLAALSNIHQSQQLMLRARETYISALAELNEILSDETQSISNSSLIAVGFLGMFEILTCNGRPLLEKYLNHAEGSAKLLQLRGSDQLKDPIGMGLFSQFRTNIILGNFWLKKPTPSWMIELSNEAIAYRGNGASPDDELFFLMAQVADICASLRHGAFIEPTRVVKEALKLDTELKSWAMFVDSSWHYAVIDNPESANENSCDSPFRRVYGKQYHLYPSTVVSAGWNDYRFVRLILLEVVCALSDHLARKDEVAAVEHQRTISNCTAVSQQLTEDICASVPYHLGATESSTLEDWNGTPLGGMTRLIWPLFVASDCNGASPELVKWIANTLSRIGHGVGIQQAVVMSNLLKAGRHLSWLPELGM